MGSVTVSRPGESTGARRGLTAVRVSRCVRDQLGVASRAVVVGVQSRACRLAVQSDGPLLILSAPEVPLAPNGIAIEVAPDVTMADAGFRVGQTVTLSPDDPGDCDADWLVVLGGAATWEPRPLVRPVAPSELDGRLRITRAAAMAEGAGESFLPLLWASEGDAGAHLSGAVRVAYVPARLLCEAAIRGDAESVAAAAGGLAGLGPGLTPSGDDFLSGFAAAWTLVGESLGLDSAQRQRVASALFSGARAGASALGSVWLGHAARGELAEPMTRFVGALFAAEPRDLVPAARGMLAVGASSGTDWTVGLLLGAAATLKATKRGLR